MTVQRYAAPESMDEAVALLSAEPRACAFAGGTDLLVQMRAGLRSPRVLVDLKRVPGLQGIRVDSHGAHIGAGTCCAEIAAHAGLRAGWPGLVEAAALIGSKQVQGRASLGGNLCNASPAADSVPALLVNGAVAIVAGPDGLRRVDAAAIQRAPGQTTLGAGEFVLAFELPPPAPGSADAYLRLIPRTEMDIAVVGAAARLRIDAAGLCVEARIALGAVAPTTIEVPEAARALLGRAIDDAALQACAQAACAAARPIDDKRATAEYRRHVAGVLARRVVQAAAARATAGEP